MWHLEEAAGGSFGGEAELLEAHSLLRAHPVWPAAPAPSRPPPHPHPRAACRRVTRLRAWRRWRRSCACWPRRSSGPAPRRAPCPPTSSGWRGPWRRREARTLSVRPTCWPSWPSYARRWAHQEGGGPGAWAGGGLRSGLQREGAEHPRDAPASSPSRLLAVHGLFCLAHSSDPRSLRPPARRRALSASWARRRRRWRAPRAARRRRPRRPTWRSPLRRRASAGLRTRRVGQGGARQQQEEATRPGPWEGFLVQAVARPPGSCKLCTSAACPTLHCTTLLPTGCGLPRSLPARAGRPAARVAVCGAAARHRCGGQGGAAAGGGAQGGGARGAAGDGGRQQGGGSQRGG